MKSFALFAAFLALANAGLLDSTRQVQDWNPRVHRSWIQQQQQQRSAQEIYNSQFENAQQDWTLYDVLGRGRQSISEQQKQWNGQDVSNDFEHIRTNEAVRNLGEWLQYQQVVAPQNLVNSQLTQKLESLLQAELSAENEMETRFQTKMQQLIANSQIQEVEVEILNQQAIISKLQQQRKWLSALIQQNTEMLNLRDNIEMQQQVRQITFEIFARQLICKHLQQALVDEQQQQVELVTLVLQKQRPQNRFRPVFPKTKEDLQRHLREHVYQLM